MPFGLTILRYQGLVAAPDELFPAAVDRLCLARHLCVLAHTCRVLPLAQALRQLQHGSLPARAVCVSFDVNGSAALRIALPLLQAAKLHATFFLADPACASDWREAIADLVRNAPGPRLSLARAGLGAYNIGTVQGKRQALGSLVATLAALPPSERDTRLRRLNARVSTTVSGPDHIIALHRAGMHIGARSAPGMALTSLSQADARAAICHSRHYLEDLLQVPVRLFAYPDASPGQADHAHCHTQMLRSNGFDGALGSWKAIARQSHDPYALPRITARERTSASFLLRLASNVLLRV